MGSDCAIRAEGLGKRYHYGAAAAPYRTLRETLSGLARVPWRSGAAARRGGGEPFWALKDVGFEVGRGEVVGIIGRNGAGKSTLLKVLSRITEPTEGYVDVFGRIGSLLEVGTGFHPELSGRENVYLNGAILGMTRAEIGRKFDEIVAFSEVERFIDTPVKHYSSGMYLRLAFAVAAHLDPEILVVDEVLAVGDAGFQKKCLGKMGEVSREGRTVLFVSHNMAAVAKLCQKAIVLERGRVATYAGVREALVRYSQSIQASDAEESGPAGVIDVRGPELAGDFDTSAETTFRFRVELRDPCWNLKILLALRNAEQDLVFCKATDSREFPRLRSAGTHEVEVRLPPLWLAPGQYSCHAKVIAESLGIRHRYVTNPLYLQAAPLGPEERDPDGTEILTPPCDWAIRSCGIGPAEQESRHAEALVAER